MGSLLLATTASFWLPERRNPVRPPPEGTIRSQPKQSQHAERPNNDTHAVLKKA
jgi:hypothetical protein